MVHQHRKPQSVRNELERLRRENEVLEKTFDGIHVLIAYMDRNFNFIRVNRNYARADNKAPEFFIGKNHFDLYPHAENQAIFQRVVETGEPYFAYEKPFTYPDRPGEVTWWDWTLQPIVEEDGRVGGVLLSLINVTDRVRARLQAAEREAHFSALFEQAADAIFMLDPAAGRFIEANPAARRLFGLDGRPVAAHGLADFAADDQARQQVQGELGAAMERGQGAFFAHLRGAGNRKVVASVSAKVIREGEHEAVLCICRDMTDQQEAQERLRRLNRALETLSACNRALVRTVDQKELLHSICRTLAGTGGFRAAAAYLVGADGAPPATATVAAGDADALPSLAADNDALPLRDLITEAAAANEPRVACTRGHRMDVGVFPLRDAGMAAGALVLLADDCGAFDAMQVELLMELAEDVSFGISTLRLRREREEGQALLERTFEATIQAVATALEMRDPYTAGHQRRVAELATAIAQRMGLAENEVRGIHMAGLIHDLGKISVPAEILNRPGRLSRVEFDIIKGHSQSGHDIIKGVELPWPVAEMVLQHHERLDGSGYPRGLKGDEIILSARILAVADVVEAITSHRPYRPGLGLQAALEEIEQNRGRLYDPAVVEACQAVFRDGFRFEP